MKKNVCSNFHTSPQESITLIISPQKMNTATHITCKSTMEGRLSDVSDCTSPSSVSERDQEECAPIDINNIVPRSQKWRKFIKKVVEGSKKSIYGSSKPLIFGYDVVSYSLNFDEGKHPDECYMNVLFKSKEDKKKPIVATEFSLFKKLKSNDCQIGCVDMQLPLSLMAISGDYYSGDYESPLMVKTGRLTDILPLVVSRDKVFTTGLTSWRLESWKSQGDPSLSVEFLQQSRI
ncbi:hypothetical protein LXL04_006968 [Taraxacum kok-saghyz]